ncbi:MAG: hypothetical protein R2754_14680 [Microthrixaceae bacterium]
MDQLPPDLELHPLQGKPLPLSDQVVMFHLVVVVVDPYTVESSWLLETAGELLTQFFGADCRVAFVATADEYDTRAFLGPWADRLLTYADPKRELAKAAELKELPALLHIDNDRNIVGRSEGWQPEEWREVAHRLATAMSWSAPSIPRPGDPVAFAGSPAT